MQAIAQLQVWVGRDVIAGVPVPCGVRAGTDEGERGLLKVMAVAQFSAPEIGWTHFSGFTKSGDTPVPANPQPFPAMSPHWYYAFDVGL